MKKFRYGFTAGLAAVFLTACAQTAGEGGYQISYVNTAGVRLVEESCTPETSGGTGACTGTAGPDAGASVQRRLSFCHTR